MINAEQIPSSYTPEIADTQLYELDLTESGIIAALSKKVTALRLEKSMETEAA